MMLMTNTPPTMKLHLTLVADPQETQASEAIKRGLEINTEEEKKAYWKYWQIS